MLDASQIGFTVRPIAHDPDGREVWGEFVYRAVQVVSGLEARQCRADVAEAAKQRIVGLIWRSLYGELGHAFRELARVASVAASGPNVFSPTVVRAAIGEVDRLLKVPVPPPGEPPVERPVNERIKSAVALMNDAERLDLFAGEWRDARACRPSAEGDYLVAYPTFDPTGVAVDIGRWADEFGWWFEDAGPGFPVSHRVTHWMPLPAPPVDGGQGR